jgi:hypothetical protein
MSKDRFPCPCCGFLTLDSPGTFDICPICNWEDDNVQFHEAAYRGGANLVSLNEARANFETLRVSDPDARERVRNPAEEEERTRVPQDHHSAK